MAKILISAVLCLAMFASMAAAAASGGCREANGTYPVSGSCDAYIQCKNGEAKEELCPDGLLYNEKSTGYPCGYPIDVDCVAKGRLQAAQPTEECPHQFGYYRMGDASHCGQFMNCASGRGYVLDCPEGLAWNPATYRCDWPDQVEDCDAEAFLGFRCPAPAQKSALLGEQEEEYDFHPSPDNCQVYFICIEGRPRRIGCGEDQAFNSETNQCDDIDNVPNCSGDIRAKGAEIKAARASAAKARQQTKSALAADASSKNCPAPFGRFASGEQCDAYTECRDGVAEDKLCPDGLLFHQRTKTAGECTYSPFSTCKERARLQPANGTAECPRQFGFYPSGDAAKCGVYRNCAHGVASITKCPEGLAFNEETYQCDWPDLVADCNAEAYLGFNCPASDHVESDPPAVDSSPEGELRYYRHPNTCKKYFVCVNGRPRLYNCGKYLAFNPETKMCDFYNRVPECYALLKEKQRQKAGDKEQAKA